MASRAHSFPSTRSPPTPPSPAPSSHGGADYLLAARANQPSLRAKIGACFGEAAGGTLDTDIEHDKGHGRIEQRVVSLVREVAWLTGDRRFPGELRLFGIACVIRVETQSQRGDRSREETRYYISSATLTAQQAGKAIRGHRGLENRLYWVLDVAFNDDQCRLRKGYGAKNMAVVRHFALNLVRSAKDTRSIKLQRKIAGWTPNYTLSA